MYLNVFGTIGLSLYFADSNGRLQKVTYQFSQIDIFFQPLDKE